MSTFRKSILAEHTASAKTEVGVFVMWTPREPGALECGVNELNSTSQVREVIGSQIIQPLVCYEDFGF